MDCPCPLSVTCYLTPVTQFTFKQDHSTFIHSQTFQFIVRNISLKSIINMTTAKSRVFIGFNTTQAKQ